MATQQLLLGSGASKEKVYLDDIFHINTYIGDGSTSHMINIGVDMTDKEGMTIFKMRDRGYGNESQNGWLFDTDRGAGKKMYIPDSQGETTENNSLKAFTTNGFEVGTEAPVNRSGNQYVNWTWIKQEKFFTTAEYTGNGTVGRTISHDLGCTPGMFIIKKKNANGSWIVWHNSLSTTTDKFLYMEEDNGEQTWENPNDTPVTTMWNNTAPASTTITVGANPSVNANGDTYIVYLFAHDQEEFGEGGNQSVMKMGKYYGNGQSDGPTVDLGWEPQYLLVKRATGTGHWQVIDSMRYWNYEGKSDVHNPAEKWSDNQNSTPFTTAELMSTGFKVISTDADWNTNNKWYIYMAIRKADGLTSKPWEASTPTKYFKVDKGNGSSAGPCYDTSFPVGMTISIPYQWGGDRILSARSMTGKKLLTNSSSIRADLADTVFDYSDGSFKGSTYNTDFVGYNWKVGQGFDCVLFKGTGSNRTIAHSLGVAPDMIIVKALTGNATNWQTYHSGANSGTNPEQYRLLFDSSSSVADQADKWNDTAPTAANFSIGTHSAVNASGEKYIAFLWAGITGLSAFGHYTGNGSNMSITTGFSPSLIIIKPQSDDWFAFDTERGLASGNDPYVAMNGSSDQSGTGDDVIDPTSTGFDLTGAANTASNLTDNNGKFIYAAWK